MPDDTEPHRFYGELSDWWPLISPVDGYAEEAAFAGRLLASAVIPVHEVLELGSGGGNNAFHLAAAGFAMTLVDLSDGMLDVSRRLNPGCEHHRGDMRSVRLGRAFDAVFVHDAVDYIRSEEDLRRAADTAFVHCRPGGVAVLVPDATTETFEPGTDHGGVDGTDGRAVRYLEWTRGPDADGTTTATDYAFLLRDADGSVRVVHEEHTHGLFTAETWLRVLSEAGFRAEAVDEETIEERTPRQFFVAHRPAG